jgi:hypothetical protein
MPTFDAIATQTVRKADHLEPAFVHHADVKVEDKRSG